MITRTSIPITIGQATGTTIAVFIMALMLSVSMVRAEIVFDNSTMTVLNNAESSCFESSSQGLINYNLEIQNDTKCIGVSFTSPPTYCQRIVRIRNPTNSPFPITVQVIPIPDGLPCPAPSYTNNRASIRFQPAGGSYRTQYNLLDMNECWNWWCQNTTYSVEKRCPFGWDSLQYLGFLGGCSDTNVTIGNPMEKCPSATFTAQGEDIYADLIVNWVNDPNNEVDVPYILKIKGYTTVYDTENAITLEQVALSDSAVSYVSGLETIATLNVSFLQILYSIFELVAIVAAVIGLPTLLIVLIKWSWEAVTGRPFGVGRRRR